MDTNHHYQSLAHSYHDVYTTGLGNLLPLTDAIIKALPIPSDSKCVDLAGGTGATAELLHRKLGLQHDILCVDVSEEMLASARTRLGVTPLLSEGNDFAKRRDINYDVITIMFAIHHFAAADRPALFRGIYNQLNPKGQILIATRPQRTDFPFFDAAHDSFAACQMHDSVLRTELEESGFIVQVHIAPTPMRIPKERWYMMLRQRFMSHLSVFSDSEVNAGIEELEKSFQDTDIFEFSDNIVLIIGQKAE